MAGINPYPPFNYSLGGRPLKYTPQELLEKFSEYLDWAKAHPIEVETMYVKRKNIQDSSEAGGQKRMEKLPRRISIEGFLVHLGLSECWWRQLSDGKQGEAFSRAKQAIKDYCEAYQKEMASVGIFNARIISRLLGIADKYKIEAETTTTNIIVDNPETANKLKSILNR